MCLGLDQDKQCIVVIDMAKAYYDICPCKGCNERKIGCHANCEKYNSWKNNGVEINNEPFIDKKKRRRK